MKIHKLLIAIALPTLLALSGCETAPVSEPVVEPTAASTPSTPTEQTAAVAPKTEIPTPTEHCAKHHQAEDGGHDCIKHCATHKGKKGKVCLKHCEHKVVAEHDCASHCAEHPGQKDQVCAQHCSEETTAKAHACGAEHCAHHEAEAASHCKPSHCAKHTGGAAHQCGTEHCKKHGGEMAECCGAAENKCE